MGMQLRASSSPIHQNISFSPANPLLIHSRFVQNKGIVLERHFGVNPTSSRSISGIGGRRTRRRENGIVASTNVAAPFWDYWKPQKGPAAPSLSDILWPSAGAFAAMAILGKMDQFLAPRGISMTIAPLGAVSAVLFAAPSSPAARKYNMFIAQIGCAAIGVLAFSIFGPGWFARSIALAASIAFMIYTGASHPPAASLPILFIDGAKLHHLNFWYALFPGAAGCILLCLIQEMVLFLKDNFKF
ncbi:uncharacterized protein LOC121235708 [Juglans microcarpa x Juglans regia]|uniref:uncharacterized protein LOC121235708 n=1 Tax=Juglans microcarpa x Juglans regia TaxID=2249226 RepID=UPI001B7EBD69|nr:uncharacterized protein LOC121235708 [Juglans microcarpa x Juglans regia]